MGTRDFIRRVTGLSAQSRFAHEVTHGRGPDPSVEESAALLDTI